MRSMMSLMNDFTSTISNPRPKSLARPMPNLSAPSMQSPLTLHDQRPRMSANLSHPAPPQDGLLTNVWPKSRMLFAIVSNMAKRGQLATPQEQGVLKDLILEEDQRLMKCYADYDALGDKDQLYLGFKKIAQDVLN